MKLLEGLDLGPLLPEHLSELIVGLVLFAVVYWVVKAKVVPIFEKTYAERTDAIQGGIERAEKAQAEAAAALADYKAQLADARGEAARIREEAKTQGASILAEMRQQATDESARLLANAKAQIEAERAAAVEQLRTQVGGLATTLAGKIVGESLDDDERARRTVDRFLEDLESKAGDRA
mgnify:CR=1 FL=1|jgi:F-type H+-transporting ATPase subunit b